MWEESTLFLYGTWLDQTSRYDVHLSGATDYTPMSSVDMGASPPGQGLHLQTVKITDIIDNSLGYVHRLTRLMNTAPDDKVS